MKTKLLSFVWIPYLFIGIEILYMISPFALYYYGLYGPSLNFLHHSPATAWLTSFFLPHYSQTNASILNALHNLGGTIVIAGFIFFLVGAARIYYAKFTNQGSVTLGLYRLMRNPQYTAFAIMGFGLLLVWPRFTVLITYISMLFTYYFLAKYEERDCLQKFGETFQNYVNTTPMFLPFHLPFTLPRLPNKGIQRIMAIALLFCVVQGIGITTGFWLRSKSISKLYGYYTPHSATLSVTKISPQTINSALDIALQNEQVKTRLNQAGYGTDQKFLNYIVPSTWYLADLPMEKIPANIHGHHQPDDYDPDKLKILFTKAHLHASVNQWGSFPLPENENIVKYTHGREPILLVKIDRSKHTVLTVETPPRHVRWGDIPTPLF